MLSLFLTPVFSINVSRMSCARERCSVSRAVISYDDVISLVQ